MLLSGMNLLVKTLIENLEFIEEFLRNAFSELKFILEFFINGVLNFGKVVFYDFLEIFKLLNPDSALILQLLLLVCIFLIQEFHHLFLCFFPISCFRLNVFNVSFLIYHYLIQSGMNCFLHLLRAHLHAFIAFPELLCDIFVFFLLLLPEIVHFLLQEVNLF